jgi:hypothetical protein
VYRAGATTVTGVVLLAHAGANGGARKKIMRGANQTRQLYAKIKSNIFFETAVVTDFQ